jgi:hypothetical protein
MSEGSYALRRPGALEIREALPDVSPFQAHPENHRVAYVLEVPDRPPAQRYYLVDPGLETRFVNSSWSFGPRLLVQCTTQHGQNFLFSLPVPRPGEGWVGNGLTLRIALVFAGGQWVRVAYDEGSKAFQYKVVRKKLKPHWLELTFDQVIEDTFHDRFIDSISHPVSKRCPRRG